jgi:soluble lytic murein transglycosylase
LAAYNAGPSRVRRWLQQAGANDAEAFVDWIPFTETRSYVKTVVRDVAIYRSLYWWGA